jgi:hypothetical protein
VGPVDEPKKPTRRRPLDDEEKDALIPYMVNPVEEPADKPEPLSKMLRLPPDMDPELRKPPPPMDPIVGVLAFPWYATSMKAFVWLTLFQFTFGFLFIAMSLVA